MVAPPSVPIVTTGCAHPSLRLENYFFLGRGHLSPSQRIYYTHPTRFVFLFFVPQHPFIYIYILFSTISNTFNHLTYRETECSPPAISIANEPCQGIHTLWEQIYIHGNIYVHICTCTLTLIYAHTCAYRCT